jgi:ferric-dicitrate binding protein FerR (iron transport regulator)
VASKLIRKAIAVIVGSVAFAVASYVLFAATAAAQTVAGSITALSGNVRVQRGTTTLNATYGMPVNIGDRIVTSSNGRATITLTDNSQLELTESSSLVINQQTVGPGGGRASTRIGLLGGLVRSLVKVTPGTPPNFEVNTPNAVASARGTMYDTSFQNGVQRKGYKKCREFTDVSVYDGTVQVSNPINPGAAPVTVTAGHKTTVPCALAPLPASALAASSSAAAGAAAATAGGTAFSTASGVILGGGIIAAGVLGGYGAAGGFGSGGGGRKPVSGSQ